MKFSADQIVATVVATSFAAGLNVYATVATLGLLAHLGVLALPPALGILASWWVIGISGALFAIEFFADKIPAFDLVWNTLHTFIRVPVAALLAYRATAALSPWEQLAATAAGGLIAFAAHGGKTAARAAVTASPEPFSNAALSLGEDGLAIFLTSILLPPISEKSSEPQLSGAIAGQIVLTGAEFSSGGALAIPVRLYVNSEQILAMKPNLRPAVVLPIAPLSSLFLQRAERSWLLILEASGGETVFSFRGVFAERNARRAESAIRSFVRVRPLLNSDIAASAYERHVRDAGGRRRIFQDTPAGHTCATRLAVFRSEA